MLRARLVPTLLGLVLGLVLVLALGCEATGPRPSPAPPAPHRANDSSAEATTSKQRPATSHAPTAAEREPSTRVASTSATPPAREKTAPCIARRREPAPPVARPAEHCPADPTGAAPLPRGRVRFADAPGEPVVQVERALSDATRARGLMYRTEMAADAGMLFSWQGDAVRSFWMRNTCLPLDMLFIGGDGTIVGILEQVPTLNTLPRGVPCKARHVLELNAGWTRQHGVLPGQRVAIEG